MKKIGLLSGLITSLFLMPKAALAHCPLCTIGAGVAVVGARYYGVHDVVLGVFIGAFAVATGWWFANLLNKKFKRQFIPYQKWIIVLASFLLTVIPILPMFTTVSSTYISVMGDYGSILNRTYLINLYLVGSILGGIIVAITPLLSKIITRLRHKTIPFQGIILTLSLTTLVALIIQWVIV